MDELPRRGVRRSEAEAARRALVQDAFDFAHQLYGRGPVGKVRAGLAAALAQRGVTGLPDATIESAATAIAQGLRPVPRW